MKLYSIPADFESESVYRIFELNSKYRNSNVFEVYGQVTENGIDSGRMLKTLPQITWNQLERYILLLNDFGIKFNYTINQSCTSNIEFSKNGIRKFEALLQRLLDIGIVNVTIALPSLIEITRSYNKNFEIKASAICEINSVTKANFYKEIGVRRIVVDPDINRKFDVLKNICSCFGPGTEIIVTNTCQRDCPYKMFHYNFCSHSNELLNDTFVKNYYENRCFLQQAESDISLMKQNWIRPEDINLYNDIGITYFKVDGRHHVKEGDYFKTLEAYFSESFSGNLYELIHFFDGKQGVTRYLENSALNGFLQKFYENPLFCSGICEKCNYCSQFIKEAKTRKSRKVTSKLATLLKENDDFKKLLQNKEEFK